MRFTIQDAPDVIPVFPLPGALLLPRGRLPLNIFEPRYLAMVDDALKTEHRLIGMIQPMNCESSATGRELYKVGCAGRLTTLSETEDGRYLIALTGACRFMIDEELEGFTPYRRVRADWRLFDEDVGSGVGRDASFDRDAFLAVVRGYFQAKKLDTDWDALGRSDVETIVNALCMSCPFSSQEKQALLEAPDFGARRATLQTLLAIDSASDDQTSGDMQ